MKLLKETPSFADQVLSIMSQDMTIDYSITQMKLYWPQRLEIIKNKINKLEEDEQSKRR